MPCNCVRLHGGANCTLLRGLTVADYLLVNYINSVRGKFVVVCLGQRLKRKFAGAIETFGRNNHAAGTAADVYEYAAALAPHVWKHGAIHAYALMLANTSPVRYRQALDDGESS
jgi:hypothetical protein